MTDFGWRCIYLIAFLALIGCVSYFTNSAWPLFSLLLTPSLDEYGKEKPNE